MPKYGLVTGALGLLGVKHCEALAEIGFNVILTDASPRDSQTTLFKFREQFPGIEFDFYQMDVSDKLNIENIAESLEQRGIYIEVLINNAAINPPPEKQNHLSRFENLSVTDWNRAIEVNLTGAFLCAQIFGTKMASHSGGSIINIASDLSVISPNQDLYRIEGNLPSEQPVKSATYSVTKTGLVGLTRYLATYWAENNVRVNAVSPGGISNGQPREFVSRVSQLIPMKRMALAHEIKGTVKLLAGSESSYLTGQNIVVDGGRSIW